MGHAAACAWSRWRLPRCATKLLPLQFHRRVCSAVASLYLSLLGGWPAYSDGKVANRNDRDFFGVGVAHGGFTRRPPISLHTMVHRTGGFAYDVGVWELSIIQGPFSGRAVPNPLVLRFATFPSLYCRGVGGARAWCSSAPTRSTCGASRRPPEGSFTTRAPPWCARCAPALCRVASVEAGE
jgi:hypothetical protein